jgi:hypothetical protein
MSQSRCAADDNGYASGQIKKIFAHFEALCGFVSNPLAHRALKFMLPQQKKNT